MYRALVTNIKCLPGWHARRKYIAFAVDDYGSVRLASRQAREYLAARLPGFGGQMDSFDAVETRDDLEALFEVLRGARDCDDRAAVFTAYSLSANPDFQHMREKRAYAYESLIHTFRRLSAEKPLDYEGTWELWEQGISEGLFRPQCHGREHFSIPLLEHKLRGRDQDMEANLHAESMAGLADVPEMPGVGFTHAFGLSDLSQLAQQRNIIADGLRLFEEIFGFPSSTFAPPALKLHSSLCDYAAGFGVKSIDRPFFGLQPVGSGKMRRSLNFLTPPQKGRVGKVVRTLSFEPCSGIKADPVGQALREIGAAFRWKKPAIISSHRVNYAGHIDPKNRKRGLAQLRQLLCGIKKNWPDVRFVTVDELVEIMELGQR